MSFTVGDLLVENMGSRVGPMPGEIVIDGFPFLLI